MSDESKEIIEEHILECEDCKMKLQAMQQELSIKPPVIKANYFKKGIPFPMRNHLYSY